MSQRTCLGQGDSGLQPERTLLAWNRTLLAMVVCSCLFLRWAPTHQWLAIVPSGLALAATAVIRPGLRRRYRLSVIGIGNEKVCAGVGATLGLSICVTALSLFGIVALFMRP
ncbi:MAG: hypothetical protein JWR17_4461 [Pseudomonas sp.]|uniref:DUF202 domain-containing protein n=1 Tax=Pseudomonas sp. TaxID=306 RepID=UPI00262C7E46|nr:DUF202 domain-containing protein [Pseudomonas sp.]MDB6051715.1 hypothetical protein [Pseudomonas sp.]